MVFGFATPCLTSYAKDALVLPHPQEIQIGQRQVPLVRGGRPQAVIVVQSDDASIRFAAQWLSEGSRNCSGTALPLASGPPATGAALLLHSPGSDQAAQLASRHSLDFSQTPDPAQAYAIVTEGDRVHVIAPAKLGIVYAAYTLAQLFAGSPGECSLPEVRVLDYPAAPVRGLLWLRGNDAYRHAYSQWAASWKINTYTWYVAWDRPLTPGFRDILRDCATRGMTLIPTLPWSQNSTLRYSDPRFVEPMLARVGEALGAGAGAFGFNFDDNPLRLFGEDEKVYDSLIAAQADLLGKAYKITGPAKAALFFCPTIYWKPNPGAQGNTLEAQYAYVRGMGRLFPPGVRTFTTTISKDWADEYVQLTGHKPVFWHNFFPNDMADWKLYFEPYPCFPAELVSRSDGAFVLGGWQTDWWKVNYLTFACNTWNPNRPCTLQEAFARLFPGEADRLVRYSLLLGGHNEPPEKMEMTDSHPHQALKTAAFFSLDPTRENLGHLQERMDKAAEAEAIAREIATRPAVPPVQAQELIAAAHRMKLNYQMALTACQVRQMEQAGERNRLASAETEEKVNAAIAAGPELERTLKQVGWPTNGASDLAVQSYFESLKTRLRSGQGAIPRMTGARCETPPVIDGRLDEAAWKQAPVSTPFYNISGAPRPATQQTEARLLFDDRALYLGFVCHEDRMNDLKTSCTRHDDAVWEDDCIEVFIDALRSRTNYDHFVVSVPGVRFEERVAGGVKNSEWNGEWTAAAQKGEKGWSVEVAIPFATLGIGRPARRLGARLGINLAREETPHKEVSAWALTFGSFHQPAMFGELLLGEQPEVAWIEAEKIAETNFLYGVQLAVDRPEARGANGTGYLNLNVGHTGGPPGDPRDGKSFWYARWDFACPKDGDYALWVLGSDQPAGACTWQWDGGPEQPERRLDSIPAAPGYARPAGLSRWWLIGSAGETVNLRAGTHALTLRVRPEDPTRSKRCYYFLDTLVVAPRDWRP